MLIDFDEVFRPWEKWENKRLTGNSPCRECPTWMEYYNISLYGSVGERQYAELPESCDLCMKYLQWKMDCMQKLKWYEDNDERLRA